MDSEQSTKDSQLLSESIPLKDQSQNLQSYDTEENKQEERESDQNVILDQAFDKIGPNWGRYQIYTILFGIALISNNCFLIYNIALFEAYPSFECQSVEGIWSACTRDEACNLQNTLYVSQRVDYTKDNSFHNWIEELNLQCVPSTEIGLLGTFLFVGILFSMFTIIPLSDKFGRRPLLILNAILGTVAYVGFFFYYNLYYYYFLMFLMGVAAALNPCVGYVYVMEVTQRKNEPYIISFTQVGEGIPTLIGPLYFMFVSTSWKPLILMGCIMSLISAIMVFKIIESPRYLYSKGKYEECEQALRQIAAFNKVEVGSEPIIRAPSASSQQNSQQQQENNNEENSQSNLTLFDQLKEVRKYFQIPMFMRNLIIMIFLWITVSFCFYLLGFYISNMEGDVNKNSLFSGIAMIIAFGASAPIINWLGNKRAFMLCFKLGVIAAGVYIIVPNKSPALVASLVFIGRLGICPCYSLTFISSNELFPPHIKSTLFAICNIVARFLCMSAPIIATFKDPIPFEIFGLMCFICAWSTQFLRYDWNKQQQTPVEKI